MDIESKTQGKIRGKKIRGKKVKFLVERSEKMVRMHIDGYLQDSNFKSSACLVDSLPQSGDDGLRGRMFPYQTFQGVVKNIQSVIEWTVL